MLESAKSPSRQGFSLFGPLFYYDLVRQARRWRFIALRCAYAVALFVALRLSCAELFPLVGVREEFRSTSSELTTNQMAGLARRFVETLLVVQTAAVFVVTPALVAGVIAEERERGTLDLLLMTNLSRREIAGSKLASRLFQLFGLLLTGLPLLALTALWGGVDYYALSAAFLMTALNAVAVGAVCLLCSAMARTVTGALFPAYVFSLLAFVVFHLADATPVRVFELLSYGRAKAASGDEYKIGLACNLVTIVWMFTASVRNLKSRSTDRDSALTPGKARRSRKAAAVAERAALRREVEEWPSAKPYAWPSVGDWPLLWKEMYGPFQRPSQELEELSWWSRGLLLVAFAAIPVQLVWLFGLNESDSGQINLQQITRINVFLTASVWCAVAAFRAASAVSRERDAQTLDSLLSIPVSRPVVFGAKALGAVLYGRGAAYLLLVVIVVGLATGILHPLGVVLLTAAVLAHLVFLTGAGLWVSVAARTTLQARVVMAIVLLAFLGGGVRQMLSHNARAVRLQSRDGRRDPEVPWRLLVAESGANAPGAWTFLSFSRRDWRLARDANDPLTAPRLWVTAGGTLAYALLGGLLGLEACRRFRKEAAS